MVQIMNLSIPESVKQYFITRKYYKKYFYKISLEIDRTLIRPSTAGFYYPFNRRSGLQDAQQSLLREICNLPVNDADCKVRTELRIVSVFTNDVEFIEEIFDKLGHRVIEFHSPKSDSHKEVLDQSIRIRVRKTLFENKFKYKIYFSQGWKYRSDNYSDIKDWLDNMEDADGTRWSTNSTLKQHFNQTPGYKGYTVAVYLNDEQDLMMCQLKFHHEIQFIEEAVLISSL